MCSAQGRLVPCTTGCRDSLLQALALGAARILGVVGEVGGLLHQHTSAALVGTQLGGAVQQARLARGERLTRSASAGSLAPSGNGGGAKGVAGFRIYP